MSSATKPVGDPNLYRNISFLIFGCGLVSAVGIVLCYTAVGRVFVTGKLGTGAAFGIQLYFWGALGACVDCASFLARDKDAMELESLQPHPLLSRLRYPTEVDVHLYLHRIVTSGIMAVVGAIFIFAGLSYFDLPSDNLTSKQRAFFILFAFLAGLYEGAFLAFLSRRFRRMLEHSGDSNDTGKETPGSQAPSGESERRER